MQFHITETICGQGCYRELLTVLCGLLLLAGANRPSEAAYSFSVKSFEVTGNLSQNAVDEFDNGIIAPWAVWDPTVTEANGVVTFQNPGGAYGPAQNNNVIITQERSGIHLSPGVADPFFVQDGNGDFQATSRWGPTLPGFVPDGSLGYGMELYRSAFLGPGQEEFYLNIGNSDSLVRSFFGEPSGSPGGLGIGFSRIVNDWPTQGSLIGQSVAIDPADITGDILFRLAYDDASDLVTASFSLDGGVIFQSPFSPMASSLAGNSTIEWDLYSDSFAAVTAVPVPAAVWLFGSGLLGLIGVARRKTRAA